jgi:GntR family transcriptional regulator / MocR family aminotransferase
MLSAGLVASIPFDRESSVPFYAQIYSGFRTAILSGRLGPGERLPSTRSLATELAISRLPVLMAFQQLLSEGYLVGKVGSGTYVADPLPNVTGARVPWWRPANKPVIADAPPTATERPAVGGAQGVFRIGIPALDRFPHEGFARVVRRHAADRSVDLLGYGDPAGYPPLRDAIATYLRSARAVNCDAGQVLIVSGSQMALQIAAMALVSANSVVCVEDPGYRFARRAIALSPGTIAPIAVDDMGINVSSLVRLGSRARLAYVTPSHQYPLGVAMTASRRSALLEWAQAQDAWIVEDDYDGQFRYSGGPLGSLRGMDRNDRVIYVGTFSTVLFPALRLGYVVVPQTLVNRFIRIRQSIDLFSPLLYQMALADFLSSGQFTRHLRGMRNVYRARRDALVQALETSAEDVMQLGNTDAGLHLVTYLPEDVDDREVVRRAERQGMYPRPLSTCYAGDSARTGLLLGFGGSDESTLASGVHALSALVRTLRRPITSDRSVRITN